MFRNEKEKNSDVKAMDIYIEAFNLFHPEIMSLTFARRDSLELEDEFEKKKKVSNEMLNDSLDLLEKLAFMNCISLKYIEHVEFLKANKICKIPDIVIDVLKRRENGECFDIDASQIILCSNKVCHRIIDEDSKGILCKRCLKKIYCSKTCKFSHLSFFSTLLKFDSSIKDMSL